ncbi:hypothetical protein GCM10014715_79290 [Streptomyces spiralis]|uniref:Uncharacterized protein n=1 Tax=Streptomyces spiralis TaxID=66376 RepID=A0A919ALL8_9ACTN|nr:hypothetical protein GCM10014715_79290 [Streptomyces spiralis]
MLDCWDGATANSRPTLERSYGKRDGIASPGAGQDRAARGDRRVAAVHLDASGQQLAAAFGTPEPALATRAVAQARGAHAEVAALISTADAETPRMLSTLSVYRPEVAAHVDTAARAAARPGRATLWRRHRCQSSVET